jgi:hypothetical protein
MTSRNYTRVYTDGGTVGHLLDELLSPNDGNSGALCGRSPWPGLWLGTGSQEEHERAADLTTCSSCDAVRKHRDGVVPA